MEINFHKITIEDKTFADKIFKDSDIRFCEYTFGNMYCWGSASGLEIFTSDDLIIFGYPKSQKFYMPAGSSDNVKYALEFLKSSYPKLTIMALSESDKDMLKKYFDNEFELTEDTRAFDYIYESEKLQSLSGKKLASKRNHINAFLSDGIWRTEIITCENTSELLTFNKKWCRNLCGHMSGSLASEMCAVEVGINNFEKLGFSGLMLFKNDKLAAYSYGEPINSDTFCVHVEKADVDIRGAYQMINREFVRTFCKNYKYVNREDDAGDEGLRRAKLSYYPTDVGRKYKAVKRK